MLLIYFPILSTTISSPLPKPWILGKTLYSSPCMVISWLQLHRDFERKSYWLLVLFVTHTWMKYKGSKQEQLSHNTVCSVTQYKTSDTTITYKNSGSSASSVEPASLITFCSNMFLSLDTAVILGIPVEQAVSKIRCLEILSKYNISDLSTAWFYLLENEEEKKSKMKSHIVK